MSVCLSVCLFICKHVSGTTCPNFNKFSVHSPWQGDATTAALMQCCEHANPPATWCWLCPVLDDEEESHVQQLPAAENAIHYCQPSWIISTTTTTTVSWPWVSRYQRKHSPTHTYPDHQSSRISVLHLLWPIASSLFNLCAWQSSRATYLQVCFGLGLCYPSNLLLEYSASTLSSTRVLT